ncbi:recombinase family protein [Methylomonas sp. SURF-1]|jgi:DNA invertase Pin-like site-specific DNA recombinase|uniref:Recombinase family protein n=2 Tax=Methylomonas TaxID=416 RepID=A0ABT1TKE4_9GAMM|nr:MULTISPECIES: recombinase family protein [unclassified Methylomonas]MCQ8105941.1 recombinase family protein [Methylomonas sp. SURF-2]MCQ8182735.1 recombinase family protein [Methylomonas sp. SURF-1]
MTSSKIGYCRVSTTEQNMAAQLELLNKADCHEIFKEKVSGSNADRPELKKLLAYIRKGDTVTVTKLDRLARSTKDLLNIAEAIKQKGADLEVLNINLDTKSPTGQLMLTMLAAIAEFERGIMLERQREGIEIAKADGKYKGRRPINEAKLQQVQKLVDNGTSVSKAVSEVGIGRRTYYKAIEEGRI